MKVDNGSSSSDSNGSSKLSLPNLPSAIGTISGARIIKQDSSESPESRVKRLESENQVLRSKLKAAEADLSQREINASCKLTTLREQINSLTSANKNLNMEYERKIKDLDTQLQDITKDKENIETQLEKAKREHEVLLSDLKDIDKYVANIKQDISQFKIEDFDEKAKYEEIKTLNHELRLVNEKKGKLLKQSTTVVSYNADRFEKTCNELQGKVKKKEEQIEKYESELAELNKEIGKLEEEIKEVDKPINLKKIKEETLEIQFMYQKMLQEYEDSKMAWDEENTAVKTDLEAVEKEVVMKKIEAANMASELDSLMIMYEQCVKELKGYGKKVKVKFAIGDFCSNK